MPTTKLYRGCFRRAAATVLLADEHAGLPAWLRERALSRVTSATQVPPRLLVNLHAATRSTCISLSIGLHFSDHLIERNATIDVPAAHDFKLEKPSKMVLRRNYIDYMLHHLVAAIGVSFASRSAGAD